jgi:AAA+ ATPase superfamily predicted ATPase
MKQFVDRDEELSRLRECYESEKGELAVIYGRRWLGKTQLVQHSLRGRDDAVAKRDDLRLFGLGEVVQAV